MDIIVSKLDLPCDIKYNIHNYLYDKLGYTHEQLKQIKSAKEKQKLFKLRQTCELYYWKQTGCSIRWLKATKTTRCGAYLSQKHEFSNILECRFHVISSNQCIYMINSMFLPQNNKYVLDLRWSFGNPVVTFLSIFEDSKSLKQRIKV